LSFRASSEIRVTKVVRIPHFGEESGNSVLNHELSAMRGEYLTKMVKRSQKLRASASDDGEKSCALFLGKTCGFAAIFICNTRTGTCWYATCFSLVPSESRRRPSHLQR
jgi:hypothetical protein